MPQLMPGSNRPPWWRWPIGRSLFVTCCLLAWAIAVNAASSGEVIARHRPLGELPMQLGGWEGRPLAAFDRDVVAALGVDEFVNRVYAAPGQLPVALYVGYYRSQREGDTIHSPLNCLPGAGWQPADRRRMTVAFGPGDRAPTSVVNRLVIEKGLDRELVLYWYQGHGRVVASEYWGRVLLAYDAFRLHRTDGALVRLIVPIESADAAAEAASERAATGFLRALGPALSEYVPR